MIAIFHALIDWGAGVHAVPRHTQLFRVSSPSSLRARFANGTLDTSAGRTSLPLVASSQPTIPIVFEFIRYHCEVAYYGWILSFVVLISFVDHTWVR